MTPTLIELELLSCIDSWRGARAWCTTPSLLSDSAGGFESLVQAVVRDLLSEMDARLARAAVVDGGPEPRTDDLLPELVSRFEVVHGIEVAGRPGGVEAVDVEVDLLGAQELGEDFSHCRSIRTVCGWVLGMVGGGNERPPARVFDSRRVSVIEPRHRPVAVCSHGRRL